jgi:hypothetical protein
VLDVYEKKVVITPKGFTGWMRRGKSGACEIPYRTMTALSWREPGASYGDHGHITFNAPGIEIDYAETLLKGEDLRANTFQFRKEQISLMQEIKAYVELRMEQTQTGAG